MANLLTLADFKTHIGYTKTDVDSLLQSYLDAAESLLSEATGQTFAAAGAVTDEAHSGSGDSELYLSRPASSITSIKVSALSNPTSPDYTIPTSDVRIDPANAHRLVRVANGIFPEGLYNIFVSYNAAANLPEIAKQAVREAAEMMWRVRGRVHVSGDSLGDLGSETLIAQERLWQLPTWVDAVRILRLKRVPGIVFA